MLGGQIVSPVLAKAIGESSDLQEWASLLESQTMRRGRGKSLSSTVSGTRAAPTKVDEKLKKELITILLKVYMSGRYMSRSITKAQMLNLPSFSKQRAIHRQGFQIA
jgi:hypothetical protein